MVELTTKTLDLPGSVPWRELAWATVQDSFFANIDKISRKLFWNNKQQLEADVNFAMRYSYLESQLSSSISDASDPLIMALFDEAAIVCGKYGSRVGKITTTISPANLLMSASGLFSEALSVSLQLLVVVGIFRQIARAKRPKSKLVLGTMFALGIAPTILSLGEWIAFDWALAKFHKLQRQRPRTKTKLEEFAFGEKKQEVILFGLKDWILAQWTKAADDNAPASPWEAPNDGVMAMRVLGRVSKAAFFMLIAARVDFPITSAALHMYERAVTSVFVTARSWKHKWATLLQCPF